MDNSDDAQRPSPWVAAARRLAAERAQPDSSTLVGLAPPERDAADSAPLESAPALSAPLYDSRPSFDGLDDSDETTHVYDDPLGRLVRPRMVSTEAETGAVDGAWEQSEQQPQFAETPAPSAAWEEAAAAVPPPVWAQLADETPLAVPAAAKAVALAAAAEVDPGPAAPEALLETDDLVALAHAPTLESLASGLVSRRAARAGSAPLQNAPQNARYLEPRHPVATMLPAPSEPKHASVTLLGLAPDHQSFAYPAGSLQYSEAPPSRSLTASDAPWSEATVVRPQPRPRSKLWPLAAAFAASLVVTVGLIVMFLLPKTGSVLVTAAGPGGAPIAQARVFFDTKPICEQVPCWISGTHAGQHFVRVEAKGYFKTSDQAVEVKAGEDVPVAVELARDVPPPTATVEIKSQVADLRVVIDGKDVGLAPLTARGLDPGEHTIKLVNPLYAPFEQSLRLSADQAATLEPKLKPLRTILNLVPGQGGEIVLVQVSGDGELIKRFHALPVRLEVDPTKTYRVTAIRKGYQDFRAEVRFDGSEAQKDVIIDLHKTGAYVAPGAGGGIGPISLEEEPVATNPAVTNAAVAASVAPAALNLHSTPVANVLVDGRPQGATPRQVSVTPGAHSIVFIHPEFGRKTFSVTVQAGKSASVMAKF